MKNDRGIVLKHSFIRSHVSGVTIDVAMNEFETKSRKFTLLDAPGHRDFIPNMISGATQADVALLVVDASTGGFESGFNQGGQTREHAILVKSLGTSQLIVAVNKMDTVQWSPDRFFAIQASLSPFLKQIGFKKDQVFFVPVSGFKGENMTSTFDAIQSWYQGQPLVYYLDRLELPKRDISKPFRMPVNDVYKGGMGGGILIDGRVEAGAVQIGDSVLIRPINESALVKGLLFMYLTLQPLNWEQSPCLGPWPAIMFKSRFLRSTFKN